MRGAFAVSVVIFRRNGRQARLSCSNEMTMPLFHYDGSFKIYDLPSTVRVLVTRNHAFNKEKKSARNALLRLRRSTKIIMQLRRTLLICISVFYCNIHNTDASTAFKKKKKLSHPNFHAFANI